ncbi:hypothetical protein MMC10_009210 [Thelotrema lepadinum]|nr:hypothetical protein [Thelotrema lepadinum]
MDDRLVFGLKVFRDTESPDPATLRKGKKKGNTNGHTSAPSNGHFPEDSNGVDSPSSADGSDPLSRKAGLSEEQKKANHIQSEQKRREKIREQYDKLAELTPGMEGQGRSEGRVLEEAAKYGDILRKEREQLIADIERRGGVVDPTLRRF